MATEQLAETVAEELEEVAEVTRHITGEKMGFFFSGVGVGVIAGFAAGYFVANHRLKTKYSKLAYDEIGRIREHYYAKETARQEKPPLNEVRIEREEVIVERPTRPPVPVTEATRKNVFREYQPEDDEVWNYETEIRARTPDVPYIIHVDEFRENTPEHDQVTCTYYEVDDVLVNSRDQQMDDMDASIGLGNLGRWGYGSNDSNIVYVRNERLQLDFEIIRDRGSYTEQTSGTIRHSANIQKNRPRRRFDDDDG
jgi:hypothetical protein